MPISFLDLVPKRLSATVVIEGESGPAEYQVTGVPLSHLAEISRKYPTFARVIEGEAGLLTAMDAMPAVIAAGLGHHGDSQYEQQAARLPPDLAISLAGEVVKLTFPQRPSLALADPEPAPAPEISANGLLPEAISPSQLSN
jgi:hypothetical protein